MNNFDKILDVIREIIEFREPLIKDFATLGIKKAIHDCNGNVIPPTTHFMNRNGVIYIMDAVQSTQNGISGTLEPYKTTDGQDFKLSHLIDMIINDTSLVEFYDVEKAKKFFQKHDSKRISRKKIRLPSLPAYQSIISDKDYKHALTTKKNKNAYLALVNPEFFNEVEFQNGAITYNNYVISTIKENIQGEYKDISEINFSLLVQLYTIAYREAKERGERTITVHLPTFLKSVGTNLNCGKPADIMKQINSFKNLVGIMPKEQTISSVFQIIEMDMANETITFATPYMNRLFKLLEEKNTKTKKVKGSINTFVLPYHNELVHAKIVSERNKPAIELVYFITTALLRRGKTADAKTYKNMKSVCSDDTLVTYSISFRSLIEHSPMLSGRIESYKTTSDKNKALDRAFKGAYKLLKSRTDIMKYFIDLSYTEITPTITTLDTDLVITHHGVNGDYKHKK